MAWKGTLRSISVAQLLDLIYAARKTGRLSLTSGRSTARLSFQNGQLIHATAAEREEPLTAALQRAGRISAEQASEIDQLAVLHTDDELGSLLVEASYVSPEEIARVVRAQVLEAVYPLFGWAEGTFHVEPDQLPPAERMTIPIELENVIMEGTRRVQEQERLRAELPDLGVALKFAEEPEDRRPALPLSDAEWRFLSFVDPHNTLQHIGEHLGLDDGELRGIVDRLLSAGLVELTVAERRQRPWFARRRRQSGPPRAGREEAA
jgi:hypothetical protein